MLRCSDVIRDYVAAGLGFGHNVGTVVFTFVNAICKGAATDELQAIKELSENLLGKPAGHFTG